MRASRGRPATDDKRRRVLDAALRMFAERGYHGTAIPEIAAAAGVAIGTLYHYFENKEELVNEVYRDAKLRIRSVLHDGLPPPDLTSRDTAKLWFDELWLRLLRYATTEAPTFRFLEMHDHIEYLDTESRHIELLVLAPLWLAGKQLRDRIGGPRVDLMLALMWGAFVGLIKANRIGHLRLDDRAMAEACATCWRMVGPESPPSRRGGRIEPAQAPRKRGRGG